MCSSRADISYTSVTHQSHTITMRQVQQQSGYQLHISYASVTYDNDAAGAAAEPYKTALYSSKEPCKSAGLNNRRYQFLEAISVSCLLANACWQSNKQSSNRRAIESLFCSRARFLLSIALRLLVRSPARSLLSTPCLLHSAPMVKSCLSRTPVLCSEYPLRRVLMTYS